MSRWPEKPCAGDGIRLPLTTAAGGRMLPLRWRYKLLSWRWAATGDCIATVDCQVHTGETDGKAYLRLGGPGGRPQVVRLASTPQPRGGVRWWWVCPRTGRLCSVLYLLPGWDEFASLPRRVSYRTQRLTPRDRALTKAQRINIRLGGDGNTMDAFPEKPKWMRWHTYDRLRAEAEEAAQQSLAMLWHKLQRTGTFHGRERT